MNELQKCLQYCQEQNGLPDCKNCGLSEEMIDEYKKEIINECVEIVKGTPVGLFDSTPYLEYTVNKLKRL